MFIPDQNMLSTIIFILVLKCISHKYEIIYVPNILNNLCHWPKFSQMNFKIHIHLHSYLIMLVHHAARQTAQKLFHLIQGIAL